ncbi:M1 family peptidase, partial [bacterium]|nr:M1 family peptidase [bacterium]
MKHVMCMLAVLAIAAGAVAAERPVLHHEAEIWLNPGEHFVKVEDTVTIPAEIGILKLSRRCQIEKIGGMDFTIDSVEREADRWTSPLEPEMLQVKRSVEGEPCEMYFSYKGYFLESTDDVVFSRENVGREIRATVGEEGAYLALDGWLPYSDLAQSTHRLTIHTPIGWEPVTQGERVRHEVDGLELVTVWDAPHPSDGLILVANKYHVTERQLGDVTAYTYFLADEPKLVETYMERTGAYLAMYGEMIGPYPYAKFATVENWFPTGYGMPSWTLLGGTVLRLPFIPTTSFGHEICHNWWGNSAFVDDTEGNWCEGLTVYCADYHYKELESDEAAREYRRNLLKDYVAYVRDGRDMPLSEFRERHSGATRAIGYGKSMMVFHMVDRLIGRAAFLDALREVWSSHMFAPAAWSDFMDACGRHGDRDLTAFAGQWLAREGAPLLSL